MGGALHAIYIVDVFLPRRSDPFPRVFNSCNQKELKSYLSSGGGKCLFNLPNTRVMYGGERCGNGYLEEGEECDCGDEEVGDVSLSCPCCGGFSQDSQFFHCAGMH